MSVQVYGCNHVAIEVDDIDKAVVFYQDVFNLEKLDRGEGDAFFKLGEHQFLAIFEVKKVQPANMRHFGIMVRDEQQLAEVRKKLTGKYKLKLEPPFRCDFHDPCGNRDQPLARFATGFDKETLGSLSLDVVLHRRRHSRRVRAAKSKSTKVGAGLTEFYRRDCSWIRGGGCYCDVA